MTGGPKPPTTRVEPVQQTRGRSRAQERNAFPVPPGPESVNTCTGEQPGGTDAASLVDTAQPQLPEQRLRIRNEQLRPGIDPIPSTLGAAGHRYLHVDRENGGGHGGPCRALAFRVDQSVSGAEREASRAIRYETNDAHAPSMNRASVSSTRASSSSRACRIPSSSFV